ncbi:hypothetical protein K470DRAFT_272190 [Piedraia hortae CBS 480.64]|uniref:Uncharacterized protein n=1 Tax=Piedraia hortae CBS 480.64 TaxID=1314780 RepID=A0A6A7BUF2_9PEZI|nr:hypothetical protein K470DRAFT_272190 [Piedraia hortae CBS 480.64]
MEYAGAYVFSPEEPPAKRRRHNAVGLQASWPRRLQTYQELWTELHDEINRARTDINVSTISAIAAFLDAAIHNAENGIPTAIVRTQIGASAEDSIAGKLQHVPGKATTFIRSGSGANLKSVLKSLINQAIQATSAEDDDEDDVFEGNRHLLKYDLQILADFVRERGIRQVLVFFEDPEAFNSHLLSELIELLDCWRDRIPFACLFTVATSVDFLQQRLSVGAVKCLRGRSFTVAPAEAVIERLFAVAIAGERVWIGPSVMSMALERQRDYVYNPDALVDAIQYAYMSHFYANAVSIFLSSDWSTIPSDHYEAVRHLPSFRPLIRQWLDKGETARAKGALESDEQLQESMEPILASNRKKMSKIIFAIELYRILQRQIPDVSETPLSKLYVQAIHGKLARSPALRTLLLTIRRQPSEVACALMRAVAEHDDDLADCGNLADELEVLATGTTAPLKSGDHPGQTVRTTVVGRQVELSKQPTALSRDDAAYTALLRRLTDKLDGYFNANLIDPKTLALHEIFIYDLKSPSREVLTPRPRHAIERALASPHDYLDCGCCAEGSGQQPATAVLYQLYLETGSLVNVSDLWTAYSAVVENIEENEATALFQRGLAELRMLGMVKPTRRKVDHIAKTMWKGL